MTKKERLIELLDVMVCDDMGIHGYCQCLLTDMPSFGFCIYGDDKDGAGDD